jgi:hypothetical protein
MPHALQQPLYPLLISVEACQATPSLRHSERYRLSTVCLENGAVAGKPKKPQDQLPLSFSECGTIQLGEKNHSDSRRCAEWGT